MKYALSTVVGFMMTLTLSIPLQHFLRTKEAQAISLRARSHQQLLKNKAGEHRGEIFVSTPPLGPVGKSAKEPKIKFLPQYPPEAAAKQIEGYVTLSFQLAENGSVQGLRVLDSRPPTVFDSAARRAVSRWNFGQQGSQGAAQGEQRLRLVFNLKKTQTGT